MADEKDPTLTEQTAKVRAQTEAKMEKMFDSIRASFAAGWGHGYDGLDVYDLLSEATEHIEGIGGRQNPISHTDAREMERLRKLAEHSGTVSAPVVLGSIIEGCIVNPKSPTTVYDFGCKLRGRVIHVFGSNADPNLLVHVQGEGIYQMRLIDCAFPEDPVIAADERERWIKAAATKNADKVIRSIQNMMGGVFPAANNPAGGVYPFPVPDSPEEDSDDEDGVDPTPPKRA